MDNIRDFVKRGVDAQKAVDEIVGDREQVRQDLQIAISGVQTTIEHTDEDETRECMKLVLKALQRVSPQLGGLR